MKRKISRLFYRAVSFVLALSIVSSVLPSPTVVNRAGIAAAQELLPKTALSEGPDQAGPVEEPEEGRMPVQMEEDHAPSALSGALSVSHVQSAFTYAGTLAGTLVVTLTVTNLQSPTNLPQLPASATLTDTLTAAALWDFQNDPNTIMDVLLVDELEGSVIFDSSDPIPDRSGQVLAWNLGDIYPLGSKSVVVEIQAPEGVVDFTALDGGAAAWGTLQGRQVSSQGSAVYLTPDTVGGEPVDEWLVRTIDADYDDEYLIAKAGELGNDWSSMFEYVRSLGYDSYKGSLRGTRGTLWSKGGNSLDQASLLIAMLRGSGIPARYRHGELSTGTAQELILSMFPEATGIIGAIPPGAELADPANDLKLLEETMDHWWVEAYLPGMGWTDLDPCFQNAAVGQTFYDSLAVDGTDRIAEAPDNLRHKVTVSVKAENYYILNFGNNGLAYEYPLVVTLNTVELTGKPVSLGHVVNTRIQGGLLFYNLWHTYEPYLVIGDFERIIEGEAYEDLISNFPFGTIIHTAEWLVFEVRDPDGNVETYQREIVDRIGYDFRQNGGNLNLGAQIGDDPMLSPLDSYTTLFAPGSVPADAFQQMVSSIQEDAVSLKAALAEAETLEGVQSPTPEQEAAIQRLDRERWGAMNRVGSFVLLTYFSVSDQAQQERDDLLLSTSYPDSPRIAIFSCQAETGDEEPGMTLAIDLQEDDVRMLAGPGQNQEAARSARFIRGLFDTTLEGQILEQTITGPSALSMRSTQTIISQAQAEGIPFQWISVENLNVLSSLDLSSEAKSRILDAVYNGKTVITPISMVTVNGEETVAWFEVDPVTGETIGVSEDGLHPSMMETFLLNFVSASSIPVASQVLLFGLGAVFGYMLTFLVFAVQVGLSPEATTQQHIGNAMNYIAALIMAIMSVSPAFGIGFANGVFIAQIILVEIMASDPPVPEVLISRPYEEEAANTASVRYEKTATYSGNTVTAGLAVSHAVINGEISADWGAVPLNTFVFDSLESANAALYAFDGSGPPLASGSVQAVPAGAAAAAQFSSGPAAPTVSISSTGTASFHSEAVSGLGTGGTWQTYGAALDSGQPFTLTLYNASVTAGGSGPFTGDFQLVVQDSIRISGAGSTALPEFGDSLEATGSGVVLQFGPSTLLSGALPVSGENNFSLAGYTGLFGVTEYSAAEDRVDLDGAYEQSLAMALNPAGSTVIPVEVVEFDVELSSNLDDTYTLTVQGPEGWEVSVDAGGSVQAVPPLGAAPGDYTILVTAQSTSHPSLLASAVHTASVTDYEGMELVVEIDLLTTVPWGPKSEDGSALGTNDGRLQLPDAAFMVGITNTSTVSHTFDISVDGLPAGWTVFGGIVGGLASELQLPAGGTGWVGLYISPTLASLPPEGTPYPFSVTATARENGALTDTENETFIVPGIAYNYLAVEPSLIMASANSTSTFTIELANVGNTAGSFELATTLPVSWTQLSTLATPVELDAGEAVTLPVEFEIADAEIGQVSTILVESPAPDSEYVQRAMVQVEIYSARTLALFETQHHLQTDCSIQNDVILPAALSYLGTAINDLEASCQDGSCAPDLRDRVVSALNAVANHSGPLSSLITVDETFRLIATAMSGHIDPVDIEADLAAIMNAVVMLDTEVCAIAHHDLEASFVPATSVVLEGTAAVVDLQVRNVGSMETTAVVTLTPPTGGSVSWANQSVALDPGEAISLPVEIEPAGQGAWLAWADIAAAESTVIQRQAAANVVVVDAFLEIAGVIPSPAFVEHGLGTAVNVFADMANVANLPLEGDAIVEALAPDGSTAASSTTPVVLPSSLVPMRLEVGKLDTTGMVTGSYTITVRIVDSEGILIPDAIGEGMLAVGQAIEASQSVAPMVVAPGTVTVTTSIETSLSQSILEQLESSARQPVLERTAGLSESQLISYSPDDYTVDGQSVEDTNVRRTVVTAGPSTVETEDNAVHLSLNELDVSRFVTGGPVAELQITGTVTQTNAGVPFPLTVVALDAIGDVSTEYSGTVAFASSDPLATLPVSYTFTTGESADNGQHTFTGVTLRTAGGQTITVSDTEKAGLYAVASFTVDAAAADPDGIIFTATSPHQADGVDASSVVVTATDGFGNPVTGAVVWVTAGGAGNTIAGSPGVTGAAGVMTAAISSTVPGVKMVRILVDSGGSPAWVPSVQLVEFTGASIEGTVFNDGNQDNVQQGGELGLGGVQVSLYESGGNDPSKTTVSASSGGYTFTGLAAGTYRIEQTQLDEFAFSGSGVLTTTVAGYARSSNNDFGNHAAGTVSGVVWTDEDQDGRQEGGEEPISGVTINAYGASSVLVDTVKTDQDGQYQMQLAADLPTAPDNFVFNSGRLLLQEPASAVIGNGDFSRERIPLDASTYPANYDFTSGAMDGWVGSNSNVTVVDDSYSLEGPYLRINQYGQYADSPEFTVPPEAQSLRFNYYNWSTNYSDASRPVYVYVLSGPGFGTSTNIGSASGSALQGWLIATIDIKAWQGQTIKLRFLAEDSSYYSTRSRIDNISLNVQVPDWTFTNALYTAIISDGSSLDGPYLRLNQYNQSAYSPAFIVPDDAQSLRFDYYVWSTRSSGESRPLYVYVLSGEDFGASTSLGSYSGSDLEGWKTAVMDIKAFAGQQIKLRFQTENSDYWSTRARLDNVALYLESPGWYPSDARYVRIGEDVVPEDPGVQSPTNADFELGLTPAETAIYPTNYDFSNGMAYLPTSTYPSNYNFSSTDLSGWSTSSSTYVGVIDDGYDLDGFYLRMNYYGQWATSPPFTVPENADSIRFDYMNWHWVAAEQGTTQPLHVYILSGPDYGITTEIGSVYGTWSQGWRSTVLDIQTFRGQTVKLRFATDGSSYWGVRSRVDNISLQVEAPDWKVSDSGFVRVVDNDYSKPGSGNYMMINRYGQWAETAPFDLPEDIQSLQFDYTSYANRQSDYSFSFDVYVLSGPEFGTFTLIGSPGGTRLEGWKSARLGLEDFAGQTVKIRFQTNSSDYWDGRAWIDNVSLNYEVPGWSTDSTSNIWVQGDEPPENPPTGFENGDLSLGLAPYDPSIYPENYDFAQTRVALDPSTYPANYDFKTGDLGGWSVSSSTYVGVISDSYSIDGTYMRINQYNNSATSPSFTVPEDAQSVRFDAYIWNWVDNTTDEPMYVYVQSGPTFEITTQVGEIWSAQEDGWVKAVLDIQTFQGETVKLRFVTSSNGYWGVRARIDNISLENEMPGGWEPSNVSYNYVQIVSDTYNLDGPYLRLNRYSMNAVSPLFTVPDGAQSLRFNYYNWTSRDSNQSGPLYISVSSGPDLSIYTSIDTVYGSGNNGWLTAQINLQAFQGQDIKLRFQTDGNNYWDYRSRIDNISINIEAPEWSLSDGSLFRVQSTGGISGSYLLLNRYSVSASPPPFMVPTSTDSIQFDYLNFTDRDANQSSPLYVYAYGGDNYSVPVLLGTVYGTKNAGWKQASISTSSIRGRMISLSFVTDGSSYWDYRSKIDNIRLVEGSGGSPQGYDDNTSSYVKLNQYNNSVTSLPFRVPSNALRLEFDYLNWSTRDGTSTQPMYVYILSGPGYGVSNLLATLNGSFIDGWRQASVDFSSYRDQVIKLRFQTTASDYWNGRSKVDNVAITVDPEDPGEAPPDVYGDGTYLHLIQYGESGYSTPFLVPTDTLTLHLDYLVYNTRSIQENRPLYVYALSGPDFGTSTLLGTLWSNNLLGWRGADLTMTAFRGQTVKLRFLTDTSDYWNGRSKVDNVYFQPFATTPYTITEINPPNFTSSTPDIVPIDLYGGANVAVDFGDFGIDRYQSTIEVSPTELVADGAATAVVTVTIKDGSDTPMPGYEVEIMAAGTAMTVLQPVNPTDANGQTSGGIRSIYAPQVALVTARTISDNVTLAATVPVTFTPGPPDEERSGLTAAPHSVVADGVDSAMYIVTLRDQFNNLVAGKEVTVTFQAASPVTQTQPLSLTNAAGQLDGTVRSLYEQTITLKAYDVTDDITVTQTAEVSFSSVDPGLSSIEVSPHTLVADGVSTSTVTVTLRNLAVGPLAGKSVLIEAECSGCSLGGGRSIGPVEIGPTGADGTAATTITSSDVEIVTISAIGDGIPLDDTAQITFTVGPVDVDASQLTGSPTTVVADGVSYASLAATLVDSYGHPVPGKTVHIRSTGTGLVMNQSGSTTDSNGQVKAKLTSTDVQLVTVSAFDQSDGITLTQAVDIEFVVGPANQANSTLVISPTTVLADGIQTAVITATLRDGLDHPVTNRPVQLVVTGQNNTITPSSVGVTGGDGRIVFYLASSKVETKDVSIRDVHYDTILSIGQVVFVPGEIDPDISTLAADKTTVFIGSDQATLTATLWDGLGHRLNGKQVQIQATGTNVTVTQPVDITNSQGQVQATVKSDTIQQATVRAVDLTDGVTLTQVIILDLIAGPVDEGMSTISITPTTIVADGVHTTVISATLHDAGDNPLVNRPVRLGVTGQSNTVAPSIQQVTDAEGHVEFTLASTKAETKHITLKDELADVTLQAGQVVFVAGALSESRSSVGANPAKTAADGQSPIIVTVYALDDHGNPIEGLDVVLDAQIVTLRESETVVVTITQPSAPTDAAGAAYGSLVGRGVGEVIVTATAGGAPLDDEALVEFEPLYDYQTSLLPPARSVPVGAAAGFSIKVDNRGYLPDVYTISLAEPYPDWFSLESSKLDLDAGQVGQIALIALTDDCLDVGTYPFYVRVASAGVGNVTTLDGSLTVTSNPALTNLEPLDGTDIGSTGALFRWQTTVSATTSLFIKPVTGTLYTEYTGAGGTSHQVTVEGLSRNADYHWYARSQSLCGSAESVSRTLSVLNGVVFSKRDYEFNVERDYNQLVSVGVLNQDTVSHTVVVTLENPYPELIIGFVGEGSIDDPFVLEAGKSRTLQLVVHAQDVTQSDFDLVARLTADDKGALPIQDAVPVYLNVHIPNIDFTLERTDFDAVTLVSIYQVTNHGDPLTDLAITKDVTGTGTIYLLPAMAHGYLGTGNSFTFSAYPAIDSGFTQVSGTILASAAGVITSTPILLGLPDGAGIYLGRAADTSMETSTADWYCTNRPVIENNLVLPPGFRRVEVTGADFYFSIDSEKSWSNVRPHDVYLQLNENPLGELRDMIPHGLYTFPVDPNTLNEALFGPSVNTLRLETVHLNGGHYVVASDMMLFLCLNQYQEWVAASSQEEANSIVSSRDFLIPAATTLDVEILAPASGQQVVAGLESTVKARITSDLAQVIFYQVTAAADNGNGTILLYDDGEHNDGEYKDGVYANTWTPVNAGTTTLTVHAGSCSVAGEAQVEVEVANLSYAVEVTHQVSDEGVVVLEANRTPALADLGAELAGTEIKWTYELTAGHTSQVNSLLLALPDMQAGEVRQVASGTVISYTGPGGASMLRLPPLYVTAQHLAALSPAGQTANLGGSAVYEVTLSNPGPAEETLMLAVAGLPESWIELAGSVKLGVGEEVMLPLTVTIPVDAALGDYAFTLVIETGSGGVDQAGGTLVVADLIQLGISPQLASVDTGGTVTYTISISNLEPEARTYDLLVTGLEGNVVELAESVPVEGLGNVSVPLRVTGHASHGYHPFSVLAAAEGALAQSKVDGVLNISGDRRVAAVLTPDEVVGGPGVTLVMTLTVTNNGMLSDTYSFEVDAPAGWTVELQANGRTVDKLALSPYLFNSADLLLLVTPSTSSLPGTYGVSVDVRSQLNPTVYATASGQVEVLAYGVGVAISPASTAMSPDDVGMWQVQVTNYGAIADTYDFTAGGILAFSADFSPDTLSLAPGESQTVQMTAGDLAYVLPKTHSFWVAATSQYDERIQGVDNAVVTFSGTEGVIVGWWPDEQTVTGTLTTLTLLITNTGNVNTVYDLSALAAGLTVELEEDQIYIPPHMTAAIQVIVQGEAGGTYHIEGTAAAADGLASSTAIAVLVIDRPPLPPQVDAGPDQAPDEGKLVSFTGVITGSAGSYSAAWSFGDGVTLTGTLTPTHIYADDGWYTVMLTVTDEFSQVVTDSLAIHVLNVAPIVNAGDDKVGFAGYPVSFSGVYTDPGTLDTHEIEWAFGDGAALTGTLAPAHTYAVSGVYSATLTVTDDDGGVGSDRLQITVREGEEQADLVVSKTVTGTLVPGRQPVFEFSAGQQVVYTLKVENLGPSNATGVVVHDSLPAVLEYVSDDGGGAYDAGSGDWLVGTLNTGLTASLHITVTIEYGTGGLTITNTATIAAADQFDPVEGNNSGSVGFKVTGYRLYVPLIMRNS